MSKENLQESMRRLSNMVEGQFGTITHQDEDATQSEVLVKGMGKYTMEQLEKRLKDRLNNVVELLERGEPDRAAALLDAKSSTYQSLMVMLKAFAEAHADLAFGGDGMGTGPDRGIDTPGEI